ncbi:radical SAM protein, partial [Vibrio anguillarum]|nr:radical SAM protein [Vibrio anguillarum]
MKYTLNALCSLDRKQHDHFGDIHFIRKTSHRDDIIIIDASTAEIFKQIRSNNVLTADVEAKNADRIARLVADNILVPLQRSAGKVKRQLTKQINLWLQVTDSCNLACDYCYIPSLYSDKVLHKDTFFQLFQHF